MKLQTIFEAAAPAMNTILKFIGRKLGHKLIHVPGVEHFKNSNQTGWGVRYILGGTLKCIRFNWRSEGAAGNALQLMSIDIFDGKHHNPSFTIKTDGVSLVQVLPAVVNVMLNPHIGNEYVFPVSAGEAMSESVLTEAKRDDFTGQEAVADFLSELRNGKSFTRSDFIGRYHIVHAGLFDTVLSKFSDRFQVSGRRVTLPETTSKAELDSLQKDILATAGVIHVTAGGGGEKYLKTKQEESIEEDPDRVPYQDSLEHLESLITAVVNDSSNALFVGGRGGSLSGETSINIIIE